MSDNPMRLPKVEKVVVNIGVGEAGEKLAKAEKVLQLVTGRKPVRTLSKTTNRDWSIKKGMPLGCKVTLRGNVADEFLKKAFWIKDNKVASYSFDAAGNFSFGVQDYTDFPGLKYDPEIGIFGMDICVTLRRKGSRVERRIRERKNIPKWHKVTMKEAMQLVKSKFSVEIVE